MRIIMYTKNNCPNCMRAEFMFSACPTEVEIEKRNVETNAKFKEELKELDSTTLPTLLFPRKDEIRLEDKASYKVYRGFEENLGNLQEELGL